MTPKPPAAVVWFTAGATGSCAITVLVHQSGCRRIGSKRDSQPSAGAAPVRLGIPAHAANSPIARRSAFDR
jgi:hypothetical protein